MVFHIQGIVVLVKKEALDIRTPNGSILGVVNEFLGQSVSLQLVNAIVGDTKNGNNGLVGKPAYLLQYFSLLKLLSAGESKYKVKFQWEESYGIPGAFIIKNLHLSQFYLKTLTIDDFPRKGRIHFICS